MLTCHMHKPGYGAKRLLYLYRYLGWVILGKRLLGMVFICASLIITLTNVRKMIISLFLQHFAQQFRLVVFSLLTLVLRMLVFEILN